MEPKKLYKTVEKIASQNFTSNTEMLISVIRELIEKIWEQHSDGQ